MAGNTLFNKSNLVNPHDVLTKDYSDYIKEGGRVSKKQDGTYAIKSDSDMTTKNYKTCHLP